MAKYTEDRIIQEIADEAVRMLDRIQAPPSASERAKNLAKKLVGRGETVHDPINWPAGLLLLGLLESGRTADVQSCLDHWLQDGAAVCQTDDAVAGYVLLRLYEQTHDRRYLDGAHRIYEFLSNAQTDSNGAIVYNASRGNSYIYADGTGQTAMFLSHYGKIADNPAARGLAARQLLLFQEHGFDRSSGLPYHGYDVKSGVKYGIIGWGRAVGWLLFGTSQYVLDAAGEEEQQGRDAVRIGQLHHSLLHAAMRYIRRDGTWSWQLEALDGPRDSSATGMILYAMARTLHVGGQSVEGIDENFLADEAGRVRDFVNGGRVYGASAECFDFAQYRQQYGCYPWGQGAILAFLGSD